MLRDLNNAAAGRSSKPSNPHARAVRILMQEFKSLQDEPMEGFQCQLLHDADLFHWEVAIFGPPETPYSGGYFKALMSFPTDFPFSPPTVKFLNKIWHPNIYHSGEADFVLHYKKVCISILHPPSDDPQSGELPQERWNPAQSVRTVLMSIISLLNEPNTASPANVDASVMYRRWKDTASKDKEYEKIIRQNVDESLKEAAKDGVKVPKNADEYTAVSRTVRHTEKRKLGEEDFYADVDWNADDTAKGSGNSSASYAVGGVQSSYSLDSSTSPLLYDADDESIPATEDAVRCSPGAEENFLKSDSEQRMDDSASRSNNTPQNVRQSDERQTSINNDVQQHQTRMPSGQAATSDISMNRPSATVPPIQPPPRGR